VDVFVRALAQAPGVHGLIVGGHPGERDLERVRALVQSLGIESRVTITGLVPPRDVIPRLRAATVLVLPNTASAISERYTSPLKLFEYLTLGRAIVASDLPAVREVLRHDDTAWLVKPGDADDLAVALRALRDHPDEAAALGARAAALAPFLHVGRPSRQDGTRARGRARVMISDRLIALTQCPDCRGEIARSATGNRVQAVRPRL
jgi:glycosyltransferase involved in cell wall biosynthesis